MRVYEPAPPVQKVNKDVDAGYLKAPPALHRAPPTAFETSGHNVCSGKKGTSSRFRTSRQTILELHRYIASRRCGRNVYRGPDRPGRPPTPALLLHRSPGRTS